MHPLQSAAISEIRDVLPRKPNSRRIIIAAVVITLSILFDTLTFSSAPARAHDWYPKECCSNHDCAPVESVSQLVPAGGGLPLLVVTSKFGRANIPHDFPIRKSKDGRMHICMSDVDLICFFMPPSM
jgi:hypothetical protein